MPQSRFRLCFLPPAGLGLLALAWASSAAATPVGSEIQVNQRTAGDQAAPDVAALPDGRFVVVWHSPDTPGDDADLAVVGRFLEGPALPSGADFQVNVGTTHAQDQARVDARGDGSFVVSWLSGYAGGKGTLDAIAARPFDSAGVGAGSEFLVTTSPNIYTQILSHDIGAASGQGFVVAFGDFYDSGLGTYTGSANRRRFDSTGALLDSEVLGTGAEKQFSTRIGGNGTSFVLTWLDWELFGQYSQTRALRLDGGGAPVGGSIDPATGTLFAGGFGADVAIAASGDWVVAWNGYDPFASGGPAQIYGRRVDSSGIPDGAGIRLINQSTAGTRGAPRMASAVDGTFLVVWESRDQPGDEGTGVRARWVASDGTPLGEEMAVNTNTTGDQRLPEVAASADGKSFLVVWQSPAGDGTDTDGTSIRARRVVSAALFGDGFESGTVLAWSSSGP